MLKATDVDGVYTADPKRDPDAKRYERLDHQEALDRKLKIMDATAFALARENRMPIIVFSIREHSAIETVLRGKGHFTTSVEVFALRDEKALITRRGYGGRHGNSHIRHQ